MDLNFFLVGCFSTFPLNGLFNSSNIFATIEWSTFTFFSMLLFPLLYCVPYLSFRVTKQNWIIVTKNTSHGLWAFHINILVIICTKKPNIKNFYHVISKLFFKHAIKKKSLFFFIFWVLVVFCLKTKVYFTFHQTFFFHYIIHEDSHVLSFIIFLVSENKVNFNLHKKMQF